MKKLFLLIFNFQFLILNSYSQSPDWLWGKQISVRNLDILISIAVDASGNVYTTDYFSGTVDFDPGIGVFNLTSAGGSDIFISKLDASGNFIWVKAIGGTGPDISRSIAIDIYSNIYITGHFGGTVDFDPDSSGTFNLTSNGIGDIFILKLDAAGNFVWVKRMGGPSFEEGRSIALDPAGNGNIYTTGHFLGTADFNPDSSTSFNLTSAGFADIFISKLDSAGNFAWAKRMGSAFSTNSDVVHSIAIDPSGSGDVYIAGNFAGTVDFDPDSSASFNLTSAGNFDIFISRLDGAGNFIWAKRMGGTGNDYGFSMALDPSGNGDVYTAGAFFATVDFDPGAGSFNLTTAGGFDSYISKLNSAGNFIWARSTGGTGDDVVQCIALDPAGSGGIYTTGYFEATVDFDPDLSGTFNLTSAGFSDIYISKSDSSGNFIWAKATGGTDYDIGRSIALDAYSNVHVAGYFYSPSIAFGSTTLTNAGAGYGDIFIAKLDTTVITGNNEVEHYSNTILLFPNPATNQFTIYNSQFAIREVVIYDLLGQKVFSRMTEAGSREQTTINVSKLPEGVYIVQIQSDDFMETKKLIVAK